MDKIKESEKRSDEFYFIEVNENYKLKEKIKDLQCIIISLKAENEKLIEDNIRLIDNKKSKS